MIKKCLKIEVLSCDPRFLESFIRNILIKLNKVKLKVIFLPKKKIFYSVLKSPFVNKKAKEHFSLKKYKRIFYIRQTGLQKAILFFKHISLKNIAVKIEEFSLIRQNTSFQN